MSISSVDPRPLVQTSVSPVRKELRGDTRFYDFGRAAFATLQLTLPEAPKSPRQLCIHLGEKLAGDGRIDRQPEGCVRYRAVDLELQPDAHRYRLTIPPDQRNTGPQAIPMPPEIGEVLPFRYAEIEGLDESQAVQVEQLTAHYPFDDEAASFQCDLPLLNDIWELCKYTIKATTFCGLYVDGDRERIPYEADAYLNQLSHYCVDREYGMARATLEHFLLHPTWPTEWQHQFIFMAWTEFLYTGDDSFLRQHYDTLKVRLLMALAREDGLISTAAVPAELLDALHLHQLRDIVDWPTANFAGDGVPGERDNYDMRPTNTAVNAFYFQALRLMNRIARQLGKSADCDLFRTTSQKVNWALNTTLLDDSSGLYLDGEGSTHSALHANMLPLAFGAVPDRLQPGVLDFIRSRGMACSVYGAQYLLDALFAAGDTEHAFRLLTATDDRSWAHMLYDLGSTMTLEAWDARYKPNLDWNHAWGAAPANLLPRWVLGVQPQQPGCTRVRVQPHLGPLRHVAGIVPVPQGAVEVEAEQSAKGCSLTVTLPEGVHGDIYLPGQAGARRVGPGRHTFSA